MKLFLWTNKMMMMMMMMIVQGGRSRWASVSVKGVMYRLPTHLRQLLTRFVLRSQTQSHNVSKSRTRHRHYSDRKRLQLGCLAKSTLIYIFYWTSDRSIHQASGTCLYIACTHYTTQKTRLHNNRAQHATVQSVCLMNAYWRRPRRARLSVALRDSRRTR